MSIKVIKCFIASPSDTSQERLICDKVINEINGSIGEAFSFRLQTLKWENDTRPAMGEYSQAVVSAQLGDDYEVFIGILNQKFGTPTKEFGSGTEEEFHKAYNRYLNSEKVEIMFYFNDAAPSKLSEINHEELSKVNEFKKVLGELGGYYWNYNGVSEYEGTLRKHLTTYLLKEFAIVSEAETTKFNEKERICTILTKRLDLALRSFKEQPIIWIEPILSSTNKISRSADESYNDRVSLDYILKEGKSIIIKSPPQFGLTCLAHHLIIKSWDNGELWIYLDAEKIKSHNIHNAVNNELQSLGLKTKDVKCIILDSFKADDSSSLKKIKNLCDSHLETPIIIMQTVDDSKFMQDQEDEDVVINREFNQLYLIGLPRNQVRKFISEYNKVKELADEDALLSKITIDLEVLNIHRTPLNCLTLLKASEKQFDESPVNRTVMLETVLFVLFNMDGIPRHKTKPDLKDCEYILGRFCESLIRRDFYEFSRDVFIGELNGFCKEKLIDVDVEIVFDILLLNNIIVKKSINYIFRATYWILYFGAKRMHIDSKFCSYIFSTKKYVSFPEIIEFYTGIDRNRSDALEILLKDISETCDLVISKVGIFNDINPLGHMKWMPTDDQIEQAQKEIGDSVIKSSLPESLKDQYADRCYDQIRPYNQSIQAFFEQYSVHNLMQNIKAASRALRNSDYVEADLKREMLVQILRSWEQVSIILFTLTPVLASKGVADIEGAKFELDGHFGNTFEEKANTIIQVNPTNVVGFFKDDLFSGKIAPLLYEQFEQETNQLKKHQLALLFVFFRPKDWRKYIEDYIIQLSKNSFYLFDIVNALKAKYQFDFTTEHQLREIEYLMRMGLAKHLTGDKKPTHAVISKVPKYEIPKREFTQDEEH